MINTANVTYAVTEQQNECVACHNCNLPQTFHQYMQKPKEHIYN